MAADPAVFGEPLRERGEWKQSPWFGWHHDQQFPEIYSPGHGWQHAVSDGGWVQFWDYSLNEWLATRGSSLYPLLYRYQTGEWLFYFDDGVRPRWFVDATAMYLEDIPSGRFFTELQGRLITLAQRYPQIVEMYPQQGSAGTTVLFTFDTDLEILQGDLKAFYDDREIQIDRVAGNFLATRVPEDADPGLFTFEVAGTLTAVEVFEVLPMQATPLISESLVPSADPIAVSHGNEIAVELPGAFLDRTRNLSISRISNPPATEFDLESDLRVYDVSIEGLSQLPQHIRISFPYDPAQLDPSLAVEDQVMVMRWHAETGVWYPLPFAVNEFTRRIEGYTDHLSLFGVLSLSKKAAEAGVAAGKYVVGNTYVTPQKNIRIKYDREHMDDQAIFTTSWGVAGPTSLALSYDAMYPHYIQDVGEVFERGLAAYIATGFKNPVSEGYIWGNYPLLVKLDSFWSTVAGIGTSDPQYEKIWQNIHLPTGELTEFQGNRQGSFAVIGHELFHRIQAEYYNILKFRQRTHFWWLEATAEYAGNRVAWTDRRISAFREGIPADFLSHSLTTTGVPTPAYKHRFYEYAAATFLEFLVEVEGFNFRELIEFVAQGEPLPRLEAWCQQKRGLSLHQLYARFVAWGLFAADSFLGHYPLADFSSVHRVKNELVETKGILDVTEAASLLASVTGHSGITVDLYVLAEGERLPANGIPYPMATLRAGESMQLGGIRKGDVIYAVATNRDSATSSATVKLESKRGDGSLIDERSQPMEIAGPLAACSWALKIDADEAGVPFDFAFPDQRTYFIDALYISYSGSGNVTTDAATKVTLQPQANGSLDIHVSRSSKEGADAVLNFNYDAEAILRKVSEGLVSGSLAETWTTGARNPWYQRVITVSNPRTIVADKSWKETVLPFGFGTLSINTGGSGTEFNYRLYVAFDYTIEWYTKAPNEPPVLGLVEKETSRTQLLRVYGNYGSAWSW